MENALHEDAKITTTPLFERKSRICDTCGQLTLSAIRNLPSISLKHNFGNSAQNDWVKALASNPPILLPLLQIESQHSSCPICQHIQKRLVQHPTQPEKYVEVWKCEDLDGGIQALWLYSRFAKHALMKITLFADEGSFASRYLPFRPFTSSGSNESILDIQKWITTCDTTHTRCWYSISGAKVRPASFLPTRVVDVGGLGETVRLVISNHTRARYVALSHCWGGQSQCRTTKGSLEQHKESLKITELSKTLQDAVIIARKLGLRYLWVDSLCIIQDDEDDWLREAGRMAAVYEGAYLTIAATASEDGSGGCFVSQETQGLVQLPCERDNAAAGHMYFGAVDEDAAQQMFYGPLNGRAWVLQEHIFARRTIHFAKDQIYWECDKYLTGQDRSNSRSILELEIPTRSLLICILGDFLGPVRMPHLVKHPPQDLFCRADYYSWWANLVRYFSKCGLTKSSDKLPALLSLSSELSKLTNDEYHEGHWFSLFGAPLFVSSLLWHSIDRKPLQKPAQFRGPSWSWAALDGSLDFADMYHGNITHMFHPEATDLHVLKIETYRPNGLPPRKSLLLSAVLIRASKALECSESQPTIFGDCMVCEKAKNLTCIRITGEDGFEIPGKFTFDLATIQPADFWLLPTFSRWVDPDRPSPVHYTLLVQEVSGQRAPGVVFERIGVGHIEDARVVYCRKRQFLVLI